MTENIALIATTSMQDTGLLDDLIPIFGKQTGYQVKTVAAGTGQALALAVKGEADVALVHAPSLEKEYVAKGQLLNRRLVLYNDFVIIGPANDPAKIKSAKSALDAMKLIAQSQARLYPGVIIPAPTIWKNPSGRTPVLRPKAPGI